MSVQYPYEGKPSWSHTCRGLHMKPAEHHTDWLGDPLRRAYEIGLLKRMHMNWVTLLTRGDSGVETVDGKPVPCHLLDEGIVPIIRDSSDPLPRPFTNIAAVKRLVAEFKPYGLRPLVIVGNEWGDDREWRNKKAPRNWKELAFGVWIEAARQVVDAGANIGFPDPLSRWEWFFELVPGDIGDMFADGLAVVAGHFYGKARPRNYPEDDVSRNGTLLTEAEYRTAMDDFWNVPGYREHSLQEINAQRTQLADADKTFLDDHTCLGAWRNIYHAAEQAWGFRPVMCMTEGGWTPKDLPGSGPNTDYRWPPSTPKSLAQRCLDVCQNQHEHGMFALTFWLSYGWSDDGWWYSNLAGIVDQETGEPYGREMPAIQLFEDNPTQPPTLSEVRARLVRARALLRQCQRSG